MSLIKRLAGSTKHKVQSDIDDKLGMLAEIADLPEDAFSVPNSTYGQYLEVGIKNQISAMILIATNVHGIESKVYNSLYETSVYDSEDQGYQFEDTPSYEGKLLISGLPFISYSGRDQWSNDQIRLFWNQPEPTEESVIKKNAKIVIDSDYRKVSFRSKTLRRHTGRYFEFFQIHQLVPYN